MKRITKITFLIVLAIFTLSTIVYAASVSIKLEAEKENETKDILLHIKLDKIDNDVKGLYGFVTDIEYDKKVFETIGYEDLIIQNGWTDISYNEESNSLVILRSSITNKTGEDIVIIKLHPKTENIDNTKIKFTNIQTTDARQDIDIPDQEITINFSGGFLKNSFIIIIIAVIIILLAIIRIIMNNRKRRKRK